MKLAAEFDPRLNTIFALRNTTERARYKLLLDGYVKASFAKDYQITREDLESFPCPLGPTYL